MNDIAAWNICMKIYKKMYKEAEPSASFTELRRKGITLRPEWFMKYYLPQERQVEIIEEICMKNKVKKYWQGKISAEIHMGCSPNTCKETWEKQNETN